MIGLLATSAGLAIVALAAGLIAAPAQSFHAPRWVVGLAGMMFVLAGAIFLTPFLVAGFIAPEQYTAGQQTAIKLIQQILGPLLLACFASVLLWIGFGSGERVFRSSIGFSGNTRYGMGNAWMGRVLFGGAGLLLGLWAAISWLTLLRGLVRRKRP